MLQTDRLAIETALRLAHAKFGVVLTLTGPKEFQHRTARIAAEANIQVTLQDRRLEEIRQQRASESASERAQRAEHCELRGKLIEQQRLLAPAPPATPKKIEHPTPSPDKKDKDRGPER